MANAKERINALELNVVMLQDEMQQLSVGMADKFQNMERSFRQTLEESMNRMSQQFNASRADGGGSSHGFGPHNRRPPPDPPEEESNPFAPPPNVPPPGFVKLEFPRFSGGDPTEWISKAKQYFSYHEMPQVQRVSFASYHLTEEANEWWQAIAKARRLDPYRTTWEDFETELWTRFGPMDGEDFDEALSHIRQKGSLIEYQREFERLQNKVEGWTEKALVGAYMGGLNTQISNGIRMFKPRTLKEIINLARLRDDQMQKERRSNSNRAYNN